MAHASLIPAVQNYAWGKPAHTSLVAKLAGHSTPADKNEGGKPFAELWIGTHPNGPARVEKIYPEDHAGAPVDDGKTTALLDLLRSDPETWLGAVAPSTTGESSRDNIPYLLKALSVNQALSIQAHPHKELAEELHRKSPELYRDSNHKPEISIPLGEFCCLCGFRRLSVIRNFVKSVPELRAVLQGSAVGPAPGTGTATSTYRPPVLEQSRPDEDGLFSSRIRT